MRAPAEPSEHTELRRRVLSAMSKHCVASFQRYDMAIAKNIMEVHREAKKTTLRCMEKVVENVSFV